MLMSDTEKKALGIIDFIVGIAFVVIGIGALSVFGPRIGLEGSVLPGILGSAFGVLLWFLWLFRRGKLGK